jgi:hypothetical protein
MLDRFRDRVLRCAWGPPYFGPVSAEVPHKYLTAEEQRFVGLGGLKSGVFGDGGGEMNTDDPIIAAIEAHRRAWAQTRAAFEHESAVEDELGRTGVRELPGEAENDPRWIVANAAVEHALAVQDDLAVELLESQPTTIAGAAALLTYYVDLVATTQPEVAFPELDGNGSPFESKSIDKLRRDFAYFIICNAAAALRNMEPEAVEHHGAVAHLVPVGAAE